MAELTQRQEDLLKLLQQGKTVFRIEGYSTYHVADSDDMFALRSARPLVQGGYAQESRHGINQCFLEITPKGKAWPQ